MMEWKNERKEEGNVFSSL